MSLARPIVGVYDAKKPLKTCGSVVMPTVMQAPIRPDLVNFVHDNLARNHRQAYGVKENAGYQTSAESWGTGRAVARIPRVPGGGTHRAGQAAFGNMCRGGGMFNPNKTWRRWHRKVNVTQRRHALASSISGSAITGLVMGRGHRIQQIPEIPLVVSNDVENFEKTKQAVALLKGLGCEEELDRVVNSKKIRAGRGKTRNRRYVMRKGPLVVYSEDNGIVRAFANVPGVDTCCVDRLNLLTLASGGTIGRFVIWTESAFQKLQGLYGNYSEGSTLKSDYILNRSVMSNPDLNRLINSNEIQSVIRNAMEPAPHARPNKNPLKNRAVMCRLNPAHKTLLHKRRCANTKGTAINRLIQKQKLEKKAAKKEYHKKSRPIGKALAMVGQK